MRRLCTKNLNPIEPILARSREEEKHYPGAATARLSFGPDDFSLYMEHGAIHIRREGRVIGLIWPCFIDVREVVANARRRLGMDLVIERRPDRTEPKLKTDLPTKPS